MLIGKRSKHLSRKGVQQYFCLHMFVNFNYPDYIHFWIIMRNSGSRNTNLNEMDFLLCTQSIFVELVLDRCVIFLRRYHILKDVFKVCFFYI